VIATPESSRPDQPEEDPRRPEQPEDSPAAAAQENSADPAAGPTTDHAAEDPTASEDPAHTRDPGAQAEPEEDEEFPGLDQATTLYVRRGRTPALGFWVLLSILVGAVVGLIVAFVSGAGDLGGIAMFLAYGAMFVGIPLAAIAALVDALRHRRR
jgi:hypothetical protein